MKKIMISLALMAVMYNASAQDSTKTKRPVSDAARYCAVMQDGQMIITRNGSRISNDITLADGVKLTVKGTLTQKDGKTRTLNVGECIDDTTGGKAQKK